LRLSLTSRSCRRIRARCRRDARRKRGDRLQSSQAHHLEYIAVRLDLVNQPVDEKTSALTPPRKPADDAVLHDAIGIQRRDQFLHRSVALAIFADEPAHGAFGEFVEVIFEMTDRAMNRARERVVGGQREIANALDLLPEVALRFGAT